MPGANDTVLNCLAALKSKYDMNEVDKTTLGTMTKIQGASTIRKALSKLKKDGCIDVDAKMVSITDKGMGQADTSTFDNFKVATNNDEKHEQVKEELNKNQIAVFDALKDGRVHDKEEIRVRLDFPKNSTWRKLLASLINKQILEYPDPKSIQLTQAMFPIVPRPE